MGEAMETSEIEVAYAGWPPVAAAITALVGLADGLYLTIKHYSGEVVPCSLVEGCEKVLTSEWSEVWGIPLAAFGAMAYFAAFSLALLVAFGHRRLWSLYGSLSTMMAGFSGFLLYLQWAVIGAFCQFCLLSAATSLTLMVLFLASLFFRKK